MTTATDTKITTQTATVAASELMRAITNAILSASTDDTLPAICAVRFRAGNTPGTLMLEATNRYQASQEEIDLADLAEYDSDWSKTELVKHMEDDHGVKAPEGYDMRTTEQVEKQHAELEHGPADDLHTHTVRPVPVTELDVMVNGKDLGKLVRTLKLIIEPETKMAHGREAPHVVITHTPDGPGYVGKASFMLINNNSTDTTVSPKAVYGDYPRIDQLMAEAEENAKRAADLIASVKGDLAAGETPDIDAAVLVKMITAGCFNAQYLAIYTKVDTGNKVDTVDLHFTAANGDGNPKPMLVRVGQRYRAMLVPVRKAG